MNEINLKDSLIKHVSDAVERSLNSSDIVSTMYQEFCETNRKAMEELKQRDKILLNTFSTIAKLYGIEFQDGFTFKNTKDVLKELTDKLSNLIDASKPKQRYLCISGYDEYGHSWCDCITEKNDENISPLLGEDSLEYLCRDDSKLLQAMSAKSGKSVGMYCNTTEGTLVEEIKEFFKDIITDQSVTLVQFSEYLECLVNTERSSGYAFKWIYI
jgi:hypothetical protein